MRFPLLVGLAASAAILGACAAPQTGMTLPAMSRQPISTRETTVYALHGLPSGQSANWAQPGHDAAHTGYNPLETILGSSNVASLQTGFNFTTGNGIFAPMVESNNVLYADSTDGNLYAVDVRTGAQLWSYPAGYGDWPQGVAVSGNRVFVTCSLDSSHAGLCRLNASTGKLAWSWAIYNDAGQSVGSSPYTGPSVSGKTVVMGESDTLSFGHVGYLVALNTTTGKIT